MPSINGVVEVISIKPLAQPDNYGNTFRAALKIQDEFYSYGTIKKDSINIKDGSDWVELQKGMEVEFMYDVNGSFKNIKKMSFTILNKEGGVAPRPSQQAPQQSSGAPASKGGYVNAAEIGQCLNLAVEVLKLDSKQLLDDKEVTKAIAWYKATREKFHELYVGVGAVATEEKPKPTPKKKPVVVEEDMYDDSEI